MDFGFRVQGCELLSCTFLEPLAYAYAPRSTRPWTASMPAGAAPLSQRFRTATTDTSVTWEFQKEGTMHPKPKGVLKRTLDTRSLEVFGVLVLGVDRARRLDVSYG